MKITQFDDKYNINLGIGGTTLISSNGSNGGFGGDVEGTWGDLSVVGLRQQVSIASNLTPVNIGDVLTIVSNGATPVAMFAAASNSTTSDTIVTVTAGATQTIDFSLGTIWDITLTANCVLTISNPPASGVLGLLLVILRQGGTGSYTVTWPATVFWDNGAGLTGGSPPTLHTAVGARNVITVITEDGGTTYGGSEDATGGSGSALTIKDEGSTLSSAATSIDFVGGGVTATNVGAAVTVTVPAGTGQHILLSDSRSTPFSFNDLLQMDDGSDFLWSDP